MKLVAREPIRTTVLRLWNTYPVKGKKDLYYLMRDREQSISETKGLISNYMRIVYQVKPNRWVRRCEI